MKDLNKKLGWAILLVVLILFFVLYLMGRSSFTYEGKNGDYKFTVEKVESVIIYRPHVFYENKEYVYAFRNKPQRLEGISMEEDILNHLERPGGLKEVFITSC